ncbi:unnamed protein product [Acanthoscelides obtectus]|uniref:MORN repeat-containing protein 5 n=1 Tax=Acanthoscelides obtectus TaxID=200917 RepID=A0A9P0LPH2_ACAOB|nr:unnamed protein product [Acanthoscelides obtectus]CAK1683792.1 MORN repeat-containing protein 5 [Acanthoscelides obtectus]
MQTVDGKKRLTVDWQNVIGDQVCGSGKFSIFRTLAYNRFVDNYGQVEFNMGRTRYCTGSSYEGSANALGFSGLGRYTYPHGAIYTGFFKNGQFHGAGDLIYPKGHRLQGIWEKGRLIRSKFIFPDGLEYDEHWKYCKFPNRFYHGENEERGTGCLDRYKDRFDHIELKDNEYFTGDGIFDADTKRIRTLDNKILRVVSCKEEAIIKNEFKRGGDHNVGLKRDLYEHWILGRQNEVEQILAVDDASTSDHIESRHLFDQPENISDCTLVHY